MNMKILVYMPHAFPDAEKQRSSEKAKIRKRKFELITNADYR